MKQQYAVGQKLLYFLSRMDRASRQQFLVWLKGEKMLANSELLSALEMEVLKKQERFISEFAFEKLVPFQAGRKTSTVNFLKVKLSQLQKALFSFLATQYSPSNPNFPEVNLVRACIALEADKYLENMYRRALKAIAIEDSSKTMQARFELEGLMNSYLVKKRGRPGQNHLDKLQLAMDNYFTLEKLKYACAGLIESASGGEVPQPPMLDSILETVGKNSYSYPLVTQAYYHAYWMLRYVLANEPKSDDFAAQFLDCFQSPEVSNIAEARDLFMYGQNYYVLQLRKGNNIYQKSLIELYLLAFERKIFEDERKLSPLFYKNAIEICCKYGEFVRAGELATNWNSRIDPEHREATLIYNRAVIQIYRGNYSGAAYDLYQHLNDFKAIEYKVGARVYLCRALWRSEQFEFLEDNLHAFTQFIYRNKEYFGERIQKYRKFIGYLSRMTTIRLGVENKVPRKMKKLLNEMDANGHTQMFRFLVKELKQFADVKGS